MTAIDVTIAAALRAEPYDPPRTVEAEDAYYEAFSENWIEMLMHIFTRALPVPLAPPRVTIISQTVKLA